jgi:hypothetical protein
VHEAAHPYAGGKSELQQQEWWELKCHLAFVLILYLLYI